MLYVELNNVLSSITSINPSKDKKDHCRLYIKNEVEFRQDWKNGPFSETYKDDFHIGGGNTFEIDMLISRQQENLLSCEYKNSLFVSIPYNNDDKMLIIMPNTPFTKTELMNFFNTPFLNKSQNRLR